MSSYTRAVVVVLFAGVAASTVAAQLIKPQFGVAAGATFPSGGFNVLSEGFNAGWQGTALVALRIAHSPVALRLDGSYGANTSTTPINGNPSERRVGLLGADADLTVTFVSPYSPRTKVYLLVGPGLYRVSHNETQPYQGTYTYPEQTKFAYNLGGGFTIGELFFEARYLHLAGFGNSSSWIMVPITAGIRFGGW